MNRRLMSLFTLASFMMPSLVEPSSPGSGKPSVGERMGMRRFGLPGGGVVQASRPAFSRKGKQLSRGARKYGRAR